MLLVLKLPSGRLVRAPLLLKSEKKNSSVTVILLISKLQSGRLVKAHCWLNEGKKENITVPLLLLILLVLKLPTGRLVSDQR